MEDINNKTYISIAELRKFGFEYPPKGTKVVVREGLFGDYDYWYSFKEKKEGFEQTIFLSPWPLSSDVGLITKFEDNVWLEFSPKIFKFEEVK